MSAKEKYSQKRVRKVMRKTNTFRISLMFVAIIMPTAAQADTVERFIYKNISDTATLPKGKQELDYHFWLEDWDIDGWEIKVVRNELTYRFGLSDQTEVGINQMHSSCL